MIPFFAVPEAAAHVAAAHPENAVQLDLGLAVVGLAYERVLDERVALQVEGHIFGTWFGPAFDEPNLSGFGFGFRPTLFLTGDAPRGAYVAPFLRVDRVKSDDAGATSTWGYSTGGFVGYSWLFNDVFNVRLGAGAQWFAYEPLKTGNQRAAFKTFFPALDLVVGYAF